MVRDKENRRRLRWTIGLAATTSLLAIYSITRSFSPVPTAPSPATTKLAVAKNSRPLDTVRETGLHFGALNSNQQSTSGIGGRNIFRAQDPGTRAHQSTTKTSGDFVIPQPPAVQSPPQIPLTFYGFADRSPESRRIFLQDSDQIFIVRLGDTIERRYKIVALSTNSVTIEDLIQNYQQLIPLSGR